jgi:hypothetical protein
MIAPPRISAWLLEYTLAAPERDAVSGDLCEAFNVEIVPKRGLVSARWWYRWQVARSLAPLILRSWERASVQRGSAAIVTAALVATMPTAALVLLRTFVLQQVPLKTTADMSVSFAFALLVLALACGAVGLAAAIRILNAESGER